MEVWGTKYAILSAVITSEEAPMYFSLKTVAGTPYLCLMQSTYVRGKHPKKTMIKRLGKLSELPQKLQEMIDSDDK